MTALLERTDAELRDQYLAGDEMAFNALVTRYGPHLRNYLYPKLQNLPNPDDAIQEILNDVWWRLFKHMASLHEQFHGWLYTVASNLAINYQRDHSRRAKRELQWLVHESPDGEQELIEFEDPHVRIEQQFDARELLDQVTVELEVGNPDFRQTLELHLDGLSYAEISEKLGAPVGTIKSRLHRTHGHLRRKFRNAR